MAKSNKRSKISKLIENKKRVLYKQLNTTTVSQLLKDGDFEE